MSKVENKGRVDYSKFDNIDSDILEAYLRADLNAPEGKQMEPETISYIIELLSERQKDNQIDWEQKTAKAVAEFQEDCLPYINEAQEIYDFYNDFGDDNVELKPDNNKKIVLHKLEKYWRRFASFAAVLVLFLFAGTVTAYALGYNPVQYIGRWNDEHFWLERVPITQELANKVAEYSDIACVPKWLPNDYTSGNSDVCEFEKYTYVGYDFYKEIDNCKNEIYIDFRIYPDPNQMASYEKDNEEVTEYTSGGITHYIMSNLDSTTIVWYNGNIEGSIKGLISIDEAKKIINSIYGE